MKEFKVSFPNYPASSGEKPETLFNAIAARGINIVHEKNTDKADYLFLYPYKILELYQICHEYRDKILIFIGGEAISPDFNLFDYSFGFDPIVLGDRHMQVSFQAALLGSEFSNSNCVPLDGPREKFCNFIYSNPRAHVNRDSFFRMLGTYKKVDSLGRHLRNCKVPPKTDPSWFVDSINQKKNYKFSISFENGTMPGYHTEKLISSMMANSMPIYWGDPEIGLSYNTKSFINCHDFNSFEEVIEYVKELDSDDEKYSEKLAQPWMTKTQEDKHLKLTDSIVDKIEYIFMQPYEKAFRKPEGSWTLKYSVFHNSFLKHTKYYRLLSDKVLNVTAFFGRYK